MDDQKYLKELISEAEDAVSFYSEARKKERERSVCAAFLRSIGTDFLVEEITPSQEEPPDVLFRAARFEVREVLDERRKRHQQSRAELQRRKRAKEVGDLREPYRSRSRLSYNGVVARVTKELHRKAHRYSPSLLATLDALVYVNLTTCYLDSNSPLPPLDALIDQGWRTVSLLVPPCAHVLYARLSAPPFLRNLVGQTKQEWTKIDGLFEL